MIDTVYIEEEIWDHSRTREVCARFPKARFIPCERYGEIFNRKAQNFRLQKNRPALILAKKYGHFILETPKGYGIGGERNFYFSHMLNCIYDCRYCFLQGMFRSANYVFYVNYEDFQQAIEAKIAEAPSAESYFFSGYDCDSLALDSVTKFTESFLPFFERHSNAWLELRTKSVQVQSLLRRDPIPNCVVAFSFTPSEISDVLEHKVPKVSHRIGAMEKLQERGWRLGLRFDPLIYHEDYKAQYERLFREIFLSLKVESLHSVSLGPFRLPKPWYENMYRLYPDEKLFAGPLGEHRGMISYPVEIEQEMLGFVRERLLDYTPQSLLYPCIPRNDPVVSILKK
ncbi:MAG: DNA photolyase [Candidatus Omnitrophica bacterium]|nr:DNA photolyase [Candidatus Omnitrophota bacterium]